MPGSRGKDFRGGDLAEGLGLELLRPFAFIAPIPRPDDVGIDAVATLFRSDADRLIAEDSFLVQVKAASIRKIKYEDEQLNWLRALNLPFFWLSVDLTSTTMELWSMAHATGHSNFCDRDSVSMYLDERPFDLAGSEMQYGLNSRFYDGLLPTLLRKLFDKPPMKFSRLGLSSRCSVWQFDRSE